MTVLQMNNQTPWYKVPAALQTPAGQYVPVMGMVDTGAATQEGTSGLLMGASLAKKMGLPLRLAGSGYSGTVLVPTYKAELPDLWLGDTHYGPQQVDVLPDSPDVPITFFIGTQFLKKHEAILNLKTGSLELQA